MSATATLRTLVAVLAFCAAGPLTPASAFMQAAKDDTVTLKDGSSKTGKVVEETYGGLELEVKKGVKQHFDWSNITAVKYALIPVEYTEAMEARSVDTQAALEKLTALTQQEGLGDVWRQQSLLALAQFQQRQGLLDEAISSWNALITAYPEGRYLGIAARGLVEAQLAKGDAAAAGKSIDALSASPAAGKFESLGLELKLLRGTILMQQKKYADARTAFEQVEKDPKAVEAVSAAAKLGVAESLKWEGKTADAETRFKALVEGSGPTFLMAGAWNGMGDLLSQKGFDTKNADLLTEALFSYLRGVVQYVPAAGESQEEYERALGGAAKCFNLLSQLEKNAERKKDLQNQFTRVAQQLRTLAPNSKYLQQF